MEKTSDGWLPLHIVARFIMGGTEGLQVMQLLLTEHPQAAKEKNSYGDLPIHLICANEKGATLEMVRELLSAYPQGINEQNGDNIKPQRAAVYFKRLPANAIDFLHRAEQGESATIGQPAFSRSFFWLFPRSTQTPDDSHHTNRSFPTAHDPTIVVQSRIPLSSALPTSHRGAVAHLFLVRWPYLMAQLPSLTKPSLPTPP